MATSSTVATIRTKFAARRPFLDERTRRVWAATAAAALGRGGASAVAEATGLRRTTVRAGLRDRAASLPTPPPGRVRAPGGGRKPLTDRDPPLVPDREARIEPVSRGEPRSPLRWTCQSSRQWAAAVVRQGHRVSDQTVAAVRHARNESLQGKRTTKAGATHPDRNAQFESRNAPPRAFQGRSQPVISVATTQQALIGACKNGGREGRPAGQPAVVRVHDFVDRDLGKASPSGVDDRATNQGWVSVGIDHDTAAFAVQSLRRWWEQLGQPTDPHASEVLLSADGGGRGGRRTRLWKTALQRRADDTGLRITVSHFPPGASKWHTIAHRLCCHLTQNWRGRPPLSRAVIVDLIGATTTHTGRASRARHGRRSHRDHGHRCRPRRRPPPASRLARRLERHQLSAFQFRCSSYSLTNPNRRDECVHAPRITARVCDRRRLDGTRYVVARAGGWQGLERLDNHYIRPRTEAIVRKLGGEQYEGVLIPENHHAAATL